MSGRSLLDQLNLRRRSIPEYRYCCGLCQESFGSQAELNKHQKAGQIFLGSTQQCFPYHRCSWCFAEFDTREELSRHIQHATSESAIPRCVLQTADIVVEKVEADDKPDVSESTNRHVARQRDEWQVPDDSLSRGKSSAESERTFSIEESSETPNSSIEKPSDKELSFLVTAESFSVARLVLNDTTPERPSATNELPSLLLHASHKTTIHRNSRVVPQPRLSKKSLESSVRGPKPSFVQANEYWQLRNGSTTSMAFGLRAQVTAPRIPLNIQVPSRTGTTATRSTGSFLTARSSFRSYRTAPSFSKRRFPRTILEPIPYHGPHAEDGPDLFAGSDLGYDPTLRMLERLSMQIKSEVKRFSPNSPFLDHKHVTKAIFDGELSVLNSPESTSLANIVEWVEEMVVKICNMVQSCSPRTLDFLDEFKGSLARYLLDFIVAARDLDFMADHVDNHFRSRGLCPLKERPSEVFSSEWLEYLKSRGLIVGPEHELDWSGRGQHVEYDAGSEKDVPLTVEKILGHSATAVVESVQCRRILRARKRIKCTRRLTKEDYITEVEHLHRLQHSHILRVVGTYTIKRDLAILLYPVATWNLDEFMDEVLDDDRIPSRFDSNLLTDGKRAISTAFGCLAHALAFIHSNNIKHMDIKPANILVRRLLYGYSTMYKVYISDFGIARAYKSALDAETDSPVSFTRTYAAPEVTLQDTRGFKADVFSLGCVFLEMLATLVSTPDGNERQKLVDARSTAQADSSYQANLGPVNRWFLRTSGEIRDQLMGAEVCDLVPRMLLYNAIHRPTADEVDAELERRRCFTCNDGPEEFEAAEEMI